MNTPAEAQLAQWRQAAHACLGRGDLQQAGQLFQRVLEGAPDDLEALQVLGAARLLAGDYSAAAQMLRQALIQAPDLFVERLRLGLALEQLSRPHDALAAYFGALRTAQQQGRWLSDETTAPGLREAVKHAMRYVDAGRLAWFRRTLEPLQQRYGVAEMRRVEHCLEVYLGERSEPIPDPRQRPKFLYFPGIPSQPYYPRERFAWLDSLEAATDWMRGELQSVLAQEQGLEAFLGPPPPGQSEQAMLSSSGPRPAAWDAYFFYRHGERYDANAAACPRTSALLDSLPLTRIRGHAPETLFSVLSPGTHILPHTGVTNVRLVTHLPLIVPPDCALRVGRETHIWQEGRCVTFDDTFEHEAWNRSEQTRAVLILDSWNPDLSEAECAAVTELIGAIGDFNAASA
ncbi:aspartyl/asparaginyl beta-hydroxylase domain-containing protein [Dyella choica]|uniref:Tetratricopeptide repeat protein n=1 Tax=Dyella choica TaxID=1927959 RepID=A0A432M0J3_9GAMM|nr:aspartyl/asparaginyl beta-hydroxylase domain-containing protein [Dyella choica]RUL70288.1 tetratricopeptide repeat protein [Dyella choica]